VNDGYLGSGLSISRAIDKYGRKNFTREILYFCESETEMNKREAELVDTEFVKRKDTYNLVPGGSGAGGSTPNKIQANRHSQPKAVEASRSRPKEKRIDAGLRSYLTRKIDGTWTLPSFSGKKHTSEFKTKMSKAMHDNQLGNKNSQFGSMWITDGTQSRKIKCLDTIPEGWYKGRVMRYKE